MDTVDRTAQGTLPDILHDTDLFLTQRAGICYFLSFKKSIHRIYLPSSSFYFFIVTQLRVFSPSVLSHCATQTNTHNMLHILLNMWSFASVHTYVIIEHLICVLIKHLALVFNEAWTSMLHSHFCCATEPHSGDTIVLMQLCADNAQGW